MMALAVLGGIIVLFIMIFVVFAIAIVLQSRRIDELENRSRGYARDSADYEWAARSPSPSAPDVGVHLLGVAPASDFITYRTHEVVAPAAPMPARAHLGLLP